MNKSLKLLICYQDMPLTGSVFTEENFKKIVEYAPIGILIIDADKKWRMVNQRFCEIIGYNKDELVGMTFLDVTHPEDRDNNLDLYTRMIKGEYNEYRFEKRYIRKDKRVIWVQLTVSAVRIDGNYSHMIALVQDVDATKKYQQKIEFSNKELDTLIYKTSHDLRAPISTLRGLTHLLKMELPKLKSNATFKHLDVTIEHLRHQNSQLLQLTQINDRELRYDEFQLEGFFGHLVGDSSLKIGQVNIDGIKGVKLRCDPELLRIIFKNLIDNSIQFSDSSTLKVNISYDNEDKQSRFTYADTGFGIDPSIQGQVFDMFFKGSEYSVGSGLGLYLTKKAIEKLKGEIQYESTPGKGTIFQIFLPVS